MYFLLSSLIYIYYFMAGKFIFIFRYLKNIWFHFPWDHSFNTCANFSKKLLFFTPWYANVRVMMMVMKYFCGMVDQRKAFSLIFCCDHCQKSSPSRISDTQRAVFAAAKNLSSGFVEWSCAVVKTTTPWRHSTTPRRECVSGG